MKKIRPKALPGPSLSLWTKAYVILFALIVVGASIVAFSMASEESVPETQCSGHSASESHVGSE